MTQWYPKLAEYDEDGWHPDQYVGREFYGVWGNFDVTIDAHRDYLIGGTGVLQNPDEVGFGYGGVEKVRVRKNKKRRWHLKRNVFTTLPLRQTLITFTNRLTFKTVL